MVCNIFLPPHGITYERIIIVYLYQQLSDTHIQNPYPIHNRYYQDPTQEAKGPEIENTLFLVETYYTFMHNFIDNSITCSDSSEDEKNWL